VRTYLQDGSRGPHWYLSKRKQATDFQIVRERDSLTFEDAQTHDELQKVRTERRETGAHGQLVHQFRT